MREEGFILSPWWGRMPFWLQCTSCWAKMWLLSPLRVLPCVLPAAARELLLIVKHSKSVVTQAFHSAFITTLWNRYCYHKRWRNWQEYKALSAQSFSHVWLFITTWTVAHEAPLSMEFPRQEYWSGLPCLLQGIFPNQGLNHISFISCISKWIFYHCAT